MEVEEEPSHAFDSIEAMVLKIGNPLDIGDKSEGSESNNADGGVEEAGTTRNKSGVCCFVCMVLD